LKILQGSGFLNHSVVSTLIMAEKHGNRTQNPFAVVAKNIIE